MEQSWNIDKITVRSGLALALNGVVMAVVVAFLLLNVGTATVGNAEAQVAQWYAFGVRGLVMLTVLMVSRLFFPMALKLHIVLPSAVMLAGGYEAVLSLMQIYGNETSNHVLFKLTGSFYNPGPLGGYLAVSAAVALHATLYSRRKYMQWMALAVLAVELTVLPATMSRTAWLAFGMAAAVLLWRYYGLGSRVRGHRMLAAFAVVVTVAAIVMVWNLKSQSALGRLFMWYMALRAVAAAPLWGSGNFQSAYVQVQEAYFSAGGSDWQKEVAGIPDSAFNWPLTLAVEQGVPLALAALAVVVALVVYAWRTENRGAACGLLTLFVFSLASYPDKIPQLVALAVVLAISVLSVSRVLFLPASLLAAVGCCAAWVIYQPRQEPCRRWQQVQFSYNSKIYNPAFYEPLYSSMRWNAPFLFEYGHVLHKSGQHERSNAVLEEAAMLSGDPMVLNIMGKNHQALGDAEKAEDCYRRSADLLPGRLYPYYLWYNMAYEFGDVKKCYYLYALIEDMKIKVESSATGQMIEEIKSKHYKLKDL